VKRGADYYYFSRIKIRSNNIERNCWRIKTGGKFLCHPIKGYPGDWLS